MKFLIIFIFYIKLAGFFPVLCFSQNTDSAKDTLHYIFMGHIYDFHALGDKVDPRIEQLDLSGYDGIWLGGDVCSEALLKYSTVQYIDSLFDLSNPNTYWALGNHDARNGNFEWLKEFTGRETYFTHYQNGITTIILNTCLVPSDCENLNNQYKMIENVCDTIQNSSHLVLLMHHGIWRDVPNLPPPCTYAQSDLVYWNAHCYSVNSTFVNAVYSLLLEVKNRGIKVLCILGDMGAQRFYMPSVDSIHFMGCWLSDNPVDDIMIFEYDLVNRKLNWEFHNLDSLLNSQR